LRHHSTISSVNPNAAPFAARRMGRLNKDTPDGVERPHLAAGHFEGVGVLVVNAGKADLTPPAANREPAVIEEATCAGLGEADERNGLRRSAQRLSFDIEQVDELLDGGAGGAEDLGEASGGRP